MDIELKQFIDNLESDIASLVYTDGEGAIFEDKFAEYCIQVLENAGETEGAIPCSYIYPGDAGKDWKVSAYCLRDSFQGEDGTVFYETIDLFITYFQIDYNYKISKDQFNKGINQIKRFLNGALKGHIDYLDPSLEITELVKLLYKKGEKFDRVNIFYLINGTSTHNIDKVIIKGFENLGIFIHVWDAQRFFRLAYSSGNREPIKIDFLTMLPLESSGIQCLKVPDMNELYECYLAILPGNVLSLLYKEFSSKLLESNVRAFLGQNGKYNKPMKKTIIEKPQMFLPYNNGLSATADYVKTNFVNGQLYITGLNDFQIVNGGQTTASLYHTEKTHKDIDLSKVYVQMKLTVIKDPIQKNIEIPFIARFANSQNRISELDLSSNNPFLLRIEELSRRKYVINPENKNQQYLWFFERTNGQYREAVSKLSISQQKAFKAKNPPSQRFIKSDVSRFINLLELEPHTVSLGAQKNFEQYLKKAEQLVLKNKLPGENFYKKLIANAIICKTVDKLFGRKNINAIGDTNLKSFSVSYTVSYFHFLTDNCLDLWKIYDEQKIDEELISLFTDLLLFVYDHLVQSANNSLISEYAKKELCWKSLKNQSFDLKNYKIDLFLITKELAIERDKEIEKSAELENEIFTISKIISLGSKFWDGFKVYIVKTGKYSDMEFDVWDLVKKIKDKKDLDGKAIRTGIKTIELIENADLNVDEIKLLSSVEDDLTLDLKALYDRIIEVKRDEWSNIIALAEKTQILDHLEIANLKSLSKALINKDKIRESSLFKGNDSLSKMAKFKVL